MGESLLEDELPAGISRGPDGVPALDVERTAERRLGGLRGRRAVSRIYGKIALVVAAEDLNPARRIRLGQGYGWILGSARLGQNAYQERKENGSPRDGFSAMAKFHMLSP